MPYNLCKIERELMLCDEKLSGLFADLEVSEDITNIIKAVVEYYNNSMTKAKDERTLADIIKTYSLYIDKLTQVKQGTLLPDNAMKQIQEITNSRKVDIAFFNLINACELLFWVAASITLYAAIFSIVLPTLSIQPIIGVAMGIGIGGLILGTGRNLVNCIAEFKSFKRHEAEYTAEATLISFFKKAETKRETEQATDSNQAYFFT